MDQQVKRVKYSYKETKKQVKQEERNDKMPKILKYSKETE
jgi:hypothetical protein